MKFSKKDGWYHLYVVHGGTNLGVKDLVNVDVDSVLDSGVWRTNGPHKKAKRSKLKLMSSKKNAAEREGALKIESDVQENDSEHEAEFGDSDVMRQSMVIVMSN